MDAHGTGNGEQNQRDNKFLVRFFAKIRFYQDIDREKGVQDEIAVKYDNISGQQRFREG